MECKMKLSAVIDAAVLELKENGYSEDYIRCQRWIYSSLTLYCDEISVKYYTEKTGTDFLGKIREQNPSRSRDLTGFIVSSIRRLNCALTGEKWQPFRKPKVPYENSCHNEIVGKYEEYLHDTGRSEKNVRTRVHIVARFLRYVEQAGCGKLTDLTASHIYEAFQASSDKYNFNNAVTAFLKYAYTYGIVQTELSLVVPRKQRSSTVPTVYSPEEIEQLLASVDRTTALGKRNYVIVSSLPGWD